MTLYPTNSKQIETAKKMQELDADGFGIVYMTMAGYNPRDIVDSDGTNFIRDYLAQITGGAAYDDLNHPDVEQRAARVRSKLAAVADEVVMFQVGVQYFLHGDLDKAEVYFNRFLEKFPSREVFNNIGLSHYQRAVEKLSSCDRFLPSRFMLPVFLDSQTIAEPNNDDSPRGTSNCLNSASFRGEIDESILSFEKAIERDSSYLPARLNLTSAFIISGNGLKAKNVARDTLQIQPKSEQALMLEAISTYLDGLSDKNDMAAPQAVKKLKALLLNNKVLLQALHFNIGMIQYENNELDAAMKNFQSVLEKPLRGIYTNRAFMMMNMKPVDESKIKKLIAPESPFKLGPVTLAIQKKLDGMSKKTDIGELRSEIYHSKDALIVVAGEMVELVSVRQNNNVTAKSFIKKYGNPNREMLTPLGSVLVYDGFAATIGSGVVSALSFYGGG